ncbi:hypothetical protein [Neobacillus muris]|uniref:hypothetical protein n=1 Tax=Neobacillus muris TaxID=2941334 RepID=UPI00203A5BEB|nr:hypothetical protein [Neobacillus muris]
MEKYSIKVNTAKKAVDMNVNGTFTTEDVQNFVRDYQATVDSIEAGSFTLEVDCTNMDILTQDMVPSLENSYKMYKESGFKRVNFSIKKNPVLKMQLTRIARNTGLTNAQVIEL